MKKSILALVVAAPLLAITVAAQQTYSSTTPTPSSIDNPGLLGMKYADLGLSLERVRGTPKPAYTAGVSLNQPLASGVDLKLGYDYWWYNYRGPNSYDDNSHYHLAAAEAKFFRPGHGPKPFASAMLGYQWSRGSYNGYVNTPSGTTTVTTPAGGASTITTTPTTGSSTTGGSTFTTTPTDTSGGLYGSGSPTDTTVPGTTSNTLTYLSTGESGNRPVWGLTVGMELPVRSFAFTPHISYTDTMEAGSDWAYHYGLEAHHWFSETIGGYADVTFNNPRRLPDSWSYFAGLRFKF